MKDIIKRIAKNQFLRNVSTLAAGTIISQIVVIAFSPVLTRLFSVDDFGVLSVFTSFTVFLAVISTGRYELSIGLPKSDIEAKVIIKLIFYIGLIVSFFYFIVIFSLKAINYQDKTEFLTHFSSYFSPLYILLIACYSALGYWYQRQKKYKLITIANSIQVISTTLFSVITGFLSISEGMIFSLIGGMFISLIFLLFKDKELTRLNGYKGSVISVAKKYISFPKFMILSDLSLTGSKEFVPILFSALYSTTIVGFFSMANRMLRLPNIMIVGAIGNVFRNDAIDEIRQNGNCKQLFISTLKKLLFIAVPTFILIFIFSPMAFIIAFGENWATAGIYARILSIMLFFEFLAVPLSTIFYIRDRQKAFMLIQVLNAIFSGLMIFLGHKLYNNATYSLILFAFNSVIFNIISLCYSFKIAKDV